MTNFSYIIRDELGIHARPAGLLVKKASEFQSKVLMKKDGIEVDAKRIFGVMGLGAKKGDEITVHVEGEDEGLAAKALECFMMENL